MSVAPAPGGGSLARAVLRSGTRFAGLNLASLAAAMLAGLVTARVLGPDLLGTWNTATIVLAYLPFLTFGVDHGAAQELPLLRGAGKAAEAERVRAVYLFFAAPVATFAAAAVAVVAALGHWRPGLRGSLLTAAALGVLVSLTRWAVIVLKSEHRFGAAGLADGARSLALVPCVPLVVALGLRGVWLANLIGALAGVLLARRLVGRLPRPTLDRSVLRRLAAFGIPITCVSLVQILSTTGDRLLVLGTLGTAALGLYGLGRTFTQVLMVSGGIVGPVVYPRMTERLGRTGDVRSLLPFVTIPTQVVGALVPYAVVASWFGLPVLIGWLLPSFAPAVRAAQVLSLATGFYLLCGAADYLIVTARRQVLSLLLYGGGVALGLLLGFAALSAGLGLPGVAAGTGIGNLVYAVTVVAVAQRLCGEPGGRIAAVIARMAAPVLLAVALCQFIERWWPVAGTGLQALGPGLLRTAVASLVCAPLSLIVIRAAWPGWRQALRSGA